LTDALPMSRAKAVVRLNGLIWAPLLEQKDGTALLSTLYTATC
jgi:hypothetical protein